jgi:hypothetical protein
MDSQGQGQEIFLHSVETDYGANPDFVQWVPGSVSPGIQQQSMKLTTHFRLVPRLRLVEFCLHSPIHLQGVVPN